MDKITFQTDGGNEVEFYVVEETRVNGVNYLLVAVEEEGDSEAMILKDLSRDLEEEANYVILEDDMELNYVTKIFSSLLEDVEIVEE